MPFHDSYHKSKPPFANTLPPAKLRPSMIFQQMPSLPSPNITTCSSFGPISSFQSREFQGQFFSHPWATTIQSGEWVLARSPTLVFLPTAIATTTGHRSPNPIINPVDSLAGSEVRALYLITKSEISCQKDKSNTKQENCCRNGRNKWILSPLCLFLIVTRAEIRTLLPPKLIGVFFLPSKPPFVRPRPKPCYPLLIFVYLPQEPSPVRRQSIPPAFPPVIRRGSLFFNPKPPNVSPSPLLSLPLLF